MFDIKRIKRSFRHAWHGLERVAQEEQSFRIQLTAALVIMALAGLLSVRGAELAVLTLAIVGVLVLELMNSIFERLADILKPRIHQYVKDIKDIMAGAVLLASIGAVIIGLAILGPPLAASLGY